MTSGPRRWPWIFASQSTDRSEQPIVIEGLDPTDWTFPDGWAASTEVCFTFSFRQPHLTLTQNCSRGAQAEHMVLITEDGYDVLTA